MSQPRPFPPDASPYWISSAFEIRQIFKMFAKRAEKVSVHLPSGEIFITVVLDVSESGELVLDASPDPFFNNINLLRAGVALHGVLDRVDFDAKMSGVRMVEYDGAPALQFELPPTLHKLQRREYFRIPTPMVKPLLCSFYVEYSDAGTLKHREYQAQVLDISVGGVCLQEPRGLHLVPGTVHRACSLVVPDIGTLRFDLTIRHSFEVENRLGRASRRAGCEFLNLSVANQQLVQKFMTKLERERRTALG